MTSRPKVRETMKSNRINITAQNRMHPHTYMTVEEKNKQNEQNAKRYALTLITFTHTFTYS